MITKTLAALVLVGAALQAPAQTIAFEITRVPSGVIPPGLETRGGTRVLGLNDLGQFVGMFGERNGTIWGVPHAFIHGSQGWGTQPGFPSAWEPGGFRLGPILGELYPDPAYRYLDLFPAAWPSAFNERVNQPLAINNAGIVVGRIGSDYLDNGPFQAYRYDSLSGQLQVLAIPGATSAEAVDINDHGDVVGHFTDATGTRGFLWRDGQITVIELPGTSGRTQLGGINNLGSIVGRTLDAGESRSFIFSGGTFELFSVDGLYTTAHDINDLGQIVGSVGISGQRRGFLYQSGQSVLLDLSDSGQSTYAYTINNLGVIGGAIEGASGGGFLATVTPIPEPATALLWLSAALLAAWRGTGRWSVRAFRHHASQNCGRGADSGRRIACKAARPAAEPTVAMPSQTAKTMVGKANRADKVSVEAGIAVALRYGEFAAQHSAEVTSALRCR